MVIHDTSYLKSMYLEQGDHKSKNSSKLGESQGKFVTGKVRENEAKLEKLDFFYSRQNLALID